MPSITTDTVQLLCPFADGKGAQSVTYRLADFDAEHVPSANPTLSVTNNQTSLIAVETGVGGDPLVVKIRTKAVKPPNIGGAVVSLSDGRTRLDGTPVPAFVIQVGLSARPDASSLELVTKGPIVDEPDPIV